MPGPRRERRRNLVPGSPLFLSLSTRDAFAKREKKSGKIREAKKPRSGCLGGRPRADLTNFTWTREKGFDFCARRLHRRRLSRALLSSRLTMSFGSSFGGSFRVFHRNTTIEQLLEWKEPFLGLDPCETGSSRVPGNFRVFLLLLRLSKGRESGIRVSFVCKLSGSNLVREGNPICRLHRSRRLLFRLESRDERV